jgi:hypothetical protein
VLDRVLAYGDGWIPVADLTDLPAQMAELARRASDAGRDPIPVSVFRPSPTPDTLSRLAELGVARAVMGLPAAPTDVVLRVLDEHAELMAKLA